MSSRPLLEGRVEEDLTVRLKRDIDRLENELRSARERMRILESESGLMRRALAELQNTLEPLYNGLRVVFGQLDAAGLPAPASAGRQAGVGDQAGRSAGENSRTDAVWQAWKSRLGGTAAKVIDALLTHRELSSQQLSMATGLHRTTIPKAIYNLNKAGLLNKNSGRFSLKPL